jgi:hypothetical protein
MKEKEKNPPKRYKKTSKKVSASFYEITYDL